MFRRLIIILTILSLVILLTILFINQESITLRIGIIFSAVIAALGLLSSFLQIDSWLKESFRKPKSYFQYTKLSLLLESCSKQTNRSLEPLISQKPQDAKKYIDNVYQDRSLVQNEFENFIDNSNSQLFIVLGEAGIGKTNFMIHNVLKYRKTQPVIFYNGQTINYGLLKHMEQDLKSILRIQESLNLRDLILLLDKQLGKLNTSMLVIVDAINEMRFMNEASLDYRRLIEEVETLLTILEATKVKVIISCRDYDWNPIWTNLQNNANIIQRLYINPKNTFRGGIFLSRFDERELDASWNKYKKIFTLQGDFIGTTRELCKHPLMLRFLSEVYCESRTPIPATLHAKEVFDKYWENKINDEPTKQSLITVADYLINKKQSQLTETEILKIIPSTIYTQLLSRSIILVRNYIAGQAIVNFAYERFFEYVLARNIIGDWLIEINNYQSAIDHTERLLKATEGFTHQKGIFEFFVLFSEDIDQHIAIMDYLIEIDSAWRLFICTIIGKVQKCSEALEQMLYELSGDSDYWIRWAARFSLAELAYRGNKSLVHKFAESGDWERREIAGFALGDLGRYNWSEFINDIEHLTGDTDWRVRRAMGYTLAGITNLQGNNFTPTLSSLSKSNEWLVRTTVACSLRDIESSPQVKANLIAIIKDLSSDTHPAVRRAVSTTIKGIFYQNPNDLILVLHQLAQDEDYWVRRQTAETLCLFKTFSSLENIDKFEQISWILAHDSDKHVRWCFARLIPHRSYVPTNLISRILDAMLKTELDSDVAFAINYSKRVINGSEQWQLSVQEINTLLEKAENSGNEDFLEQTIRTIREALGRFKLYKQSLPNNYEEFREQDIVQQIKSDPYIVIKDILVETMVNSHLKEEVLLELIRYLSKDESEGMRWAVAYAIRFHQTTNHSREFTSILIDLLKDRHQWIRREACSSLPFLPYVWKRALLPSLNLIMSDPYFEVKAAFKEALTQKGFGDWFRKYVPSIP